MGFLMAHFVKVATIEELTASGSIEVESEGRILALFLQGQDVIALDGMCAHQGGPIARGAVHKSVVTCPWHGWQFDLRSGRCLTARSVSQTRYEVRIDGPDILVEIP